MGMIGTFYSVTDGDLAALVEKPSRVRKLMGFGEEISFVGSKSFFGRLFGKQVAVKPKAQEAWQPEAPTETTDVDKAWQGIHFLLTGDIGEGEHPLGFIMYGGREIAEETGFGPPRGFSAAEVKGIAAGLKAVDIDQLYERADPAVLAENAIYPEIWDEAKEECIGYLTDGLRGLREFVEKLAAGDRGMVVMMT